MVQSKNIKFGVGLRIAVAALLLILTSITVVPQENSGRINIHVTRSSSPDGIADVPITLQGPYPGVAGGALTTLYKPNPALTPDMTAQIDALIASAPPTISAEVVANAAIRMEANLLGLPAPTPPALAAPGTPVAQPPQVSALTDRDGLASFSNLAPGRYQIRAQHDGYFAAAPPGSTAISLPTAATATAIVDAAAPTPEVTIKLVKGATVSGRVRDPNGMPLTGAQIYAYRLTYQISRMVLQSINSKATDDRGEFRLFWLPPGEYYMAVTPQRRVGLPSAQDTYARTFFPGTTDAKSATRVKVTEGGDIAGIDINVRGNAGRITGRVVTSIVGPNGQPQQAGTFYLLPRDTDSVSDTAGMNFPNSASDRTNGKFEIRGVTPGSYDLITVMSDGANGQAMGRAHVDVGSGSLDEVTLNVQRGLTLKARLTLDTGAVPYTMTAPQQAGGGRGNNITAIGGFPSNGAQSPAAQVPTPAYRVTLRSMEAYAPPFDSAAQGNTTFDPSGVFVFPNVPDGRYTVAVASLPPNFYIADVRVGEKSVVDDGFIAGNLTGNIDVTVSSKGAKVSGIVRDTDQNPVASALVVLVPAPARRQNPALYKTATSDAKGNYNITGVAPGDYKLFAWDSIPGSTYMNAEFMTPYEERGQNISIMQGGSATADVLIIK